MTQKELKLLVLQGEHTTLEFKKKVAHANKIVREIVAFANSQGGELLIGVADNGNLSGIQYPEEERWVLDKAIAELCHPQINFSTEAIAVEGRRWVLRYIINEGKQKPYFVKEKAESPAISNNSKKVTSTAFYRKTYIRKNDRSIQASREVREILRRQNGQRDTVISWGLPEQVLMRYLQENKAITVRKFAKEAGVARSVASGILIRMVLANIVRIIPSEEEDTYIATHIN